MLIPVPVAVGLSLSPLCLLAAVFVVYRKPVQPEAETAPTLEAES